MILEQAIEQKIIAAIKGEAGTSGRAGVYYSGVWSEASSGSVKGDEGQAAAVVAVTVGPRSMDEFGTGGSSVPADFAVTVACTVAAEHDPTGQLLMDLYEDALGAVWPWVKYTGPDLDSDLVVTHEGATVFYPSGAKVTGGQGPVYVQGAQAWTWTISFTIRGIINQ